MKIRINATSVAMEINKKHKIVTVNSDDGIFITFEFDTLREADEFYNNKKLWQGNIFVFYGDIQKKRAE